MRILLCFLVLMGSLQAEACTAFTLLTKAGPFTGRNYDWQTEQAWVLVNRRGMEQEALLNPDEGRPPIWTSRYGSVTLDQYGRGFPCSGMNEKGLSIDVLWLDQTRYPKMDGKPAVSELQLVQYLLDVAADVPEALKLASNVRVTALGAEVHYYLADKAGNRAVLEFLHGKAVVSIPSAGEPFCITNDSYQESAAWCAKHLGDSEGARGSLPRFCRALNLSGNTRVENLDSVSAVQATYNILKSVEGPNTVWSIVYDPIRGRMYLKTAHAPELRSIDLGKQDFSPSQDVAAAPLVLNRSGDISPYLNLYTSDINLNQVSMALKAFGNPMLSSEKVIKMIADFQMRRPKVAGGKAE